jgi:hypothetical protein
MYSISVISVGKKEFEELTNLGIDSTYIRHPSRGSKTKFCAGIQGLFY